MPLVEARRSTPTPSDHARLEKAQRSITVLMGAIGALAIQPSRLRSLDELRTQDQKMRDLSSSLPAIRPARRSSETEALIMDIDALLR